VKSEIAGYAFTTLNPVVGVVRVADNGTFEGGLAGNLVHDETWIEEQREQDKMDRGEYASALTRNQRLKHGSAEHRYGAGHHFDLLEAFRFTIADNPGLISQASENVGLGHSFLRSMERSLALVYVVDLSGSSPWNELRTLRDELEKYQPGMSSKARMVVANKADLLGGHGSPVEIEEAEAKLHRLEEYVKAEMTITHPGHGSLTLDVVATSAKFSQNLPKVVNLMRTYVEQA